MTKPDYFIQIHEAADATTLRGLRILADADQDLTVADLAQVNAAIGKKFARMNAAAVGSQRGRWDPPHDAGHPIRIPSAHQVH
jgi:hypothetical protein